MNKRFSCAWKLKIVASGLCESITQEFTALMRDRDLNGLSDWMHKATATGVWTSRFRAASPARASFRHP